MKAAVITRYGSPDIVKIGEAPKPAPARGEVLVRVRATTVTRTDCGELRPGLFGRLMYGLLRPRRSIFGMDFAGVVESLGAEVEPFRPGDRVFGMCPPRNNGAQAEYVCIPESGPIAVMPKDTPFDEAAVCEGAYYAKLGLAKFDLGPGHKILIYGASGIIGLAAVQFAKGYGAEVTAVVATRHLELAKDLGADRTVDYTAGDFTRLGERFDVVLDAVGKLSFFRCRRLLKLQRDVYGNRRRPLGTESTAGDLVVDRKEPPGPRSPAAPRRRPRVCRVPQSAHGGGPASRHH